MYYAMMPYTCSHKRYRQTPCEKPLRHWTVLWRAKQPCNLRLPSVENPKCYMDRLTRLPGPRRGDPNCEQNRTLVPQPRYVGVEPRPRDTSTSPPPERRGAKRKEGGNSR